MSNLATHPPNDWGTQPPAIHYGEHSLVYREVMMERLRDVVIGQTASGVAVRVLVVFTLVSTAFSALANGGCIHDLQVCFSNGISSWEWWSGFAQNAGTEFIGGLVTFFLFEQIVGGERRRQAEARDAEEKKQAEERALLEKKLAEEKERQADEQAREDKINDLIRRLKSEVHDVHKAAYEEILDLGWFRDGTLTKRDLRSAKLQGVNLMGANLQGAYLRGANLQGAYLRGANLQGADLRRTDLQGAKLGHAELQGANLEYANLQAANLLGANLQEAKLWLANLQGAKLWDAELQGADLRDATLQGATLWGARLQGVVVMDYGDHTTQLDENTTLPNRTNYDPAQGLEQLERFGVTVMKSWEEYNAWREAQRNKDTDSP